MSGVVIQGTELAGMIRFVGGPLHNKFRNVTRWEPFVDMPVNDQRDPRQSFATFSFHRYERMMLEDLVTRTRYFEYWWCE